MKRLLLAGVLLVVSGAGARAFAQAADGKALYEDICRKCHGAKGTPPAAIKKKYEKIVTFDAAFMAKRSDDSVVKVLTKGVNENMKSFKEKLTKEEMAAVAKYMRELTAKEK